MKNLEKNILSSVNLALGFFIFEVVFTYIGFLCSITMNQLNLPLSFATYLILISTWALIQSPQIRKILLISISIFILFSLLIFGAGKYIFANTYDTSWDGQGYHSSGVISLAKGWNPIYQQNLPINLPDAAIFVKGYPKALWLVQSSIYLTTGQLDAAKVTNLAALILSVVVVFYAIKRFNLPILVTVLLAIGCVLQAHFMMQLFSFMQDGFVYQLVIMAIAWLFLFYMDRSFQTFIGFFLSESILVGTKYSTLPMVVILGVLFLLVLFIHNNKSLIYFDHDHGPMFNGTPVLSRKNILLSCLLTLGILIYIWSPYATNFIWHRDPLYPSNNKPISDSYIQNNVPNNLVGKDKLSLLFYGIYSKSQINSGGNSQSPENIATLKIPFTYTPDEVLNQLDIFNNRVGASGPLFSGIFTLSLFVALLLLKITTPEQKNKVYLLYGLIVVILFSNLVNPVPNLIRYNGQILIIPTIIIITALSLAKNNLFIKLLSAGLILAIFLNMIFFSVPLLVGRLEEIKDINAQLGALGGSGKNIYSVKADNFYSDYIRLDEHHVQYQIVNTLSCSKPTAMYYSLSTTKLCIH